MLRTFPPTVEDAKIVGFYGTLDSLTHLIFVSAGGGDG
jgi:hypothetical protein